MQAHVIPGRVLTPLTPQIQSLMGTVATVTNNNRTYAVLPHEESVVKVLRNIGADLPPPVHRLYDWAGSTPYASQRATAGLLTMEERAYDLSTMGVGKTRAAAFSYDWLRKSQGIGPALVVAPLSTLTPVWDRELFEVFPHLKVVVVHGTREKRKKLLSEQADVYVINHDGVKVVQKELASKSWGVVIIDEASAYSNASTDRWKALNSIVNPSGKPPVRAWALTGSPTPDAPTDAFGIARLITPWTVPKTFRRFQLMTMTQVSNFRWVANKEANDIVAAALRPSVRFTLDECHDIPDQTVSYRDVPMSPKQQAIYDRMTRHFVAEVKGQQITAVNEGAKLQKLLQISAGFAYSNETGAFIESGPRLKELFNLIAESERKVLVFAAFKWMVYALQKALSAKYTTEAITGDTPKSERDRIFTLFRNSPDPHVIVAHAGTMAHGLTLIEATTIVWYGPTLSSELYEQANARIRRPGQTCKTHIVHIQSSQVEKRAFARLRSKQRMQGMLLEILSGLRGDP